MHFCISFFFFTCYISEITSFRLQKSLLTLLFHCMFFVYLSIVYYICLCVVGSCLFESNM